MKLQYILIITIVLTMFSCGIKEDKDEKGAKKIVAEDFFKSREQTNFRISPDGQYIAYIGSKNNHNNIFIRKIGQPPDVSLTNTDRDINSFYWGNKDYILYLQDNDGDENYRLYRINIYNREIKCLTDFENVQTGIIDLLRSQDENIIIRMNQRDPEIFDPYRLNIVTGDLELLYRNPGKLRGWMTDNSGKIRFATSDVLLYRKDDKSELREVIELGPDDVFDPEFFTGTNEHVYAYSNIGRDKIAIVEFDPDEGKEVKVLFESPEYDAFGDDERDSFTCSPSMGRLLFARYTAEKRELVFFDRSLEKIYKKIKRKIGNDYEINFTSFSNDLTQFIIHVSSDRLEGIYYYYDNRSGYLEKLHSDSPWLEQKEMAEMKPISFRARDGLLIHGYLTLPKGLKPEGLPVVVNPHAGPQWRNSWVFDLKTQFLANRGYAVLQVNFRGSEGYGKQFLRAGFRQWGLKMQDDITDGVNWLIDQGIADKNRIAIFGGSFGGYAALAGVTFTPDLYACGIDLWGISNYFTLYRSFPSYWKSALVEINERWGDIGRDSVQMYQTSPVFHADQVKAPLLIFQGANDVRVKRGQSDEMVEALRKRNKEVEYVLIQGEGHGFSDEKRLIDQMKKIEDFLARHIGSR
jgi:dipeptidyl aminopeptidase/acylaminoacyl peptidase